MPNSRFTAAVMASLALIPALDRGLAGEEKGPLWILSGQSNACGRAKLPGPSPLSQVTMFHPASGKFVVAQDPLPHMGTRGTGPWVAAGQTVARHSGLPIQMCGFASGGKSIRYWHPGQPGHRGLFPVIAQAGQKADVFLWYQGENDCGGRMTTEQYQQELKAHVARVRKAAGHPAMLALIVQLGPTLRKGRGGYMAIREAQRRFVVSDPHAVLVPALGRTLKDSVHLNNAGYRELGREIGRALLRLQHGKSVGAWPGPVLDEAVLSLGKADRNSVVAHFAEAEKLLHLAAADFAVVDAEGTNRCRAVEIPQGRKTLVSLTLERDVVLPARLIYGFGSRPKASLTDEAGNRAPAVQVPIRLGDAPSDRITRMPNGAGK